MKLLLLILMIVPVVWGEEPSQEEVETYLEAVKDVEVSKQLANSQQYQTCKSRSEAEGIPDPAAVFEKCMAEEFQNVTDDQMEELAENLNLKSFNKTAAKSAQTIREYLSQRLRKALYGVSDLDKAKLKDRNMVNHDVYYQLYAEQIGKNTLLEISKYCLENVYFEDKTNILVTKRDATANSGSAITGFEAWSAVTDKREASPPAAVPKEEQDFKYEVKELPGAGFGDEMSSVTIATSFNPPADFDPDKFPSAPIINLFVGGKLRESEVCTLNNQKKCDAKYESNNKQYKSVNLITQLKEAEYKYASKDGQEAKVLKDNYLFCAGHLIQNMCEMYKCNNVYTTESEDDQKKLCGYFGITLPDPTAARANTKKDGAIACNVMKRLAEYRNILKATKDIQDERKFLASQSETSGVDAGKVFKGVYASRGQNSVDRLTSISSKELTENVEAFAKSEEYSQELKDTCFNDPNDLSQGLNDNAANEEACQVLVNKLDKLKFQNIQESEISITEVQKKELDQVKDEKALLAFLQKHGMTEYYEQNADGSISGKYADMDVEQIKKVLQDELETEKKSLVDNLKNRFYTETKINEEEPAPVAGGPTADDLKDKVAEETIADIEKHKERVQALFEYSNLVSSYLTVNDSDGNAVSENSTSREIELANQDSDTLSQYFSDAQSGSSSSSSSGSINYLQAIDQVIGVKELSKDEIELREQDDDQD